ncbi:protein ECT2-like isoform X2 [Macrosteles quadrilineatus]|uniref:protein ECT2-like isoform X2 n=1 Tax=Macrosteles quadrilineatus TaxID=74068 RepID=UPI0023E257F2|nr:protein ECT2-like isoform X2 [Macrosteles quadrilineatus]
MEEANDSSSKNTIKQLKSVESSDLDDENSKDSVLTTGSKLCLVGAASLDVEVEKAAKGFGLEVLTSEDGSEWQDLPVNTIYFVLEEFEGNVFDNLHKLGHRLLGTTALRELAARQEPLPHNNRPLYSLAMWGLIVAFTGFRKKEELKRLIQKIHNMGGSIRSEMNSKVTHLVAQRCGGSKYQYAMTFRVPIVAATWVHDAWAMRSQPEYSAADSSVITCHKLKPFQGARVCFLGFPEDEQKHMAEVLVQNGGTLTDHEDAMCSHMVLDSAVTYDLIKAGAWVPQSPPPCTPLPSTSTPCSEAMDISPTKSEAISAMDISPDHPFHKEIAQAKIELMKTSSEKIGRRLSLTPTSPGYNSPFSNRKNKTDLTPIKESSPLTISPNKICAKKELDFSDNDECASPKFDAKRRKTMSPSELNQNRKFKKSPSQGFKKFAHSSLRKSFKMKTHTLARWISSSDVCMKASPRVNDKSMPPPPPPTPLLASSPSLGNITGQEESHGMPMVVDESTVSKLPDQAPQHASIVKAEWFWASVQNEGCVDEKDYLFEDNTEVTWVCAQYLESLVSPSRRTTPLAPTSRARKRKRLQEAVARLASGAGVSPATNKRRSSVSDAGLLSVSGSFLDCTNSPATNLSDGDAEPTKVETPLKNLSPRHQVFLELVQTEFNYVNTLKTIMTLYKEPLEQMCETPDQLLSPTEVKIIFGHLPPIYETHCRMLEQLRHAASHWTEDTSIGNIILNFSGDLVKAYPPYVNFYETTREMLLRCDQTMPRFHAFLKIGQTKPECGRQSLLDLLIRPVQRLPSINLLLNDILKHTNKSNPDHSALQAAAASIREVTTHINEDKRRTEGQMVMFDIFNDIENCPPHLVSSHRSFITRCDITELSDGLSGRGDALAFFLFSDIVEVCKKRSKAFNSLKSPNTAKLNGQDKTRPASFKHVRLMPLSHIKMVIDITETEDCHNKFALVVKSNQELREKRYSFRITDEGTDKMTFLRTLCRQMANTLCRPDAENFLASLNQEELDIDTSDIGVGTLKSKAAKFASRTRIKVGRAFSFNKTPNKLKRAMSTMMSPFGSTSNLTPASQLAQMRLASCNNLNELGSATPPPPAAPPLSVQPTRRNKHPSLSVASLRRL